MMKREWALSCVLLVACLSGDGDGQRPDGGDHDRSDGGAQEGPGDDDVGGDGGSDNSGERQVCERFIDCAREVTPTGVTGLIATYGDEGTCWSLPGVTESDCEAECDAARKALFQSFPTAACGECGGDQDCGDGNICVEFACTTLGLCLCPPDYPDCPGGDDDDFIDIPDCGGLCPGEPCEGQQCGDGLVCASYQGAPKVCSVVCTQDEDCGVVWVCSPQRDSQGRGLCISKSERKCESDEDCGLSGGCLPDGSCGCRDNNACDGETVCTR